MDEVKFTTLTGGQLYFSRSLGFIPRVGERVSFPADSDWYKVTAVYHEIGDTRRVNTHTVILEKM
jgi:hypothetical protein